MLFKVKPVKIIIYGFNDISLHLAQNLSKNKDVVIIYNQLNSQQKDLEEPDVIIEEINSGLVTVIKKYITSVETLFIALTIDEEINIFAAQLAKKLGAAQVMALVYDRDYSEIDYDIDLIFNPYQILCDKINTKIRATRLKNIKNLIPGKINLTQIKVTKSDSFSDKSVKDINLNDGLVIAINRGNKKFLPEARTKIMPGDILYIIYKRGENNWLQIFSPNYLSRKKLFLSGGGGTGIYLINYWKHIFDPVIIIEPDLDECNKLAGQLDKPLILHGESTELQLFKEEGLNQSSIYLAVSQNDLTNILSSFAATKLGCQTVVTIINYAVHLEIAELLGLKDLIFLPEVVTDYILSFLETGLKIDKYILGSKICTVEIKLKPKSYPVNRMIQDLKLPDKLIIGVISRDQSIIIPTGNTTLKKGDKLIVFFDRELESEISHIF